nr:hypothetical protein [Tanacetum cinerariifolium]GEX64184.1 hypothetical protein [Tanacetum cinerariifolium]
MNDDDDDKSIDLEKTNGEENDDEFVHSEEYVQDDDEETDDELVNGDEQVNDDEDEEMTMLKMLTLGTTMKKLLMRQRKMLKRQKKDTTNPISIHTIPVSVISKPSVLTPIPKTPSVVPATTLLPPPTISSISDLQLQTTTPIPSPLITTKAPPVTTILDPLHAIIQRVFVLEKDVQELKDLGDELQKVLQKHTEELIQKYPRQVDYKEIIKESMPANLINEVKNQFPKSLPKALSYFAILMIQSTVKNSLEKTLLPVAQSFSQAQSSLKLAESLSEYELKIILFNKMDQSHSYLTHNKHQALFDALFNSLILGDAIAHGEADPEKVMRKRYCDNEDPLARPNQGKKTKRSRTKESKPSKKSSTFKESSKVKSPTKTSKFGKSVTVEEPVKELVFEMAFDDIKQTIDDVANDADQPLDESN